MSEKDPRRLSDEGSGASDQLQELIAAGRQERPEPDRVAGIAASLGLPPPPFGGGGSGADPSGGGSGMPPPGVGSGASLTAGAASGGHGAALWTVLGGALGVAALIGVGLMVIPEDGGDRPEPAPAVETARIETEPEEEEQAPAPPTEEIVVEETADDVPPRPPEQEAESEQGRAIPSTRRGDGGAADPRDDLRLLQQARAELGANPGGALALLRRHRSRYPTSTFTQERDVLEIDALVRLGRDRAARSRAERFRSRFPGSAHQHRVSQLVEPGATSSGDGSHSPADVAPSPLGD